MDFKKLVPWNWFKNEEEDSGSAVPVQRHVRMPQRQISGSRGQFHQDINKVFDTFFQGFAVRPYQAGSLFAGPLASDVLRPVVDIGGNEKEYTVTLEVPGVDQKDIKLELVNDTLTIHGEKKLEKEEKEKNYYRMERSYGSFQRVLALPDDANQDEVQATFKNGVLTVSMPRRVVQESALKQVDIR